MEGIYEKSGKQRKAPTQPSRRGKRVKIAEGTTSWGKDISSQVGTPTKSERHVSGQHKKCLLAASLLEIAKERREGMPFDDYYGSNKTTQQKGQRREKWNIDQFMALIPIERGDG
jgi:hypothetical protein